MFRYTHNNEVKRDYDRELKKLTRMEDYVGYLDLAVKEKYAYSNAEKEYFTRQKHELEIRIEETRRRIITIDSFRKYHHWKGTLYEVWSSVERRSKYLSGNGENLQ